MLFSLVFTKFVTPEEADELVRVGGQHFKQSGEGRWVVGGLVGGWVGGWVGRVCILCCLADPLTCSRFNKFTGARGAGCGVQGAGCSDQTLP
jgi:hypothetical protein